MKIQILFDKFKGSLSSAQACAIAREELRRRFPEAEFDATPTSDGGDGFCELLTTGAGGSFETLAVRGPRGAALDARLGLVDGDRLPAAVWPALRLAPCRSIAVLEMAQASGLAQLQSDERDPWLASSLGTGELLLAAARRGADAVLLGVGGSATNDCGLGALSALGLRGLDPAGRVLPSLAPAFWEGLSQFSGDALTPLPPLRIACDVDNPLLGPQGASTIYAPQKGLSAGDLPRMEAAVERVSALLCRRFGRDPSTRQSPGAGAAGGIAFGLGCACGAELVSGFDVVGAWLGLEEKIATADLVITGEGRFDLSSLQGKGPGAIVRRVLARDGRICVFAGSISEELRQAYAGHPGLQLIAISPLELPLPEAMAQAGPLLRRALTLAFA